MLLPGTRLVYVAVILPPGFTVVGLSDTLTGKPIRTLLLSVCCVSLGAVQALARILVCEVSDHVNATEEPSVVLEVHLTLLPLPVAVILVDVPGLPQVIGVLIALLLDL